MVQESPKQDATEIALPDKKYFKIGETSTLLGVKPHVLRYWETEFPQIRPFKSKTGQRLYRRRDVEALVKIQRLLYQERFTIAGARQALRQGNWADNDDEMVSTPSAREPETVVSAPAVEKNPPSMDISPMIHVSLLTAKKELESILQLVDDKL